MNIIIFDYLDRVISLQAPSDWLKDFFYHPNVLEPLAPDITQRYIEECLALHNLHYPNAQKVMKVSDDVSFASIPESEITYIEHGLAFIDFPTRSALLHIHNSDFFWTEYDVSLLNPAQPNDRAKLLHIQALIQKDLIQLDPEFADPPVSHLRSISSYFTLGMMEAMINEKLSDYYCYTEPKKLSVFDLPYVQPAPTFIANDATTGWSVNDCYFSIHFVEDALALLLPKKLLLTPAQEKSWMAPGHNTSHLFEPLHLARIKKEHDSLNEHVANSLTLHSKRNKL